MARRFPPTQSFFNQIQMDLMVPLHMEHQGECVEFQALDGTWFPTWGIVQLNQEQATIKRGQQEHISGTVLVDPEYADMISSLSNAKVKGQIFKIGTIGPLEGGVVKVTVTRMKKNVTHATSALDSL